MKTIYLDADFKCHVNNNGTMIAIKTEAFDDKCDAYIEGYRFIPIGSTWTRDDGMVFHGEMIAPWKSWDELDSVQREYEKQLIQEQAAIIAELDEALLNSTYNNIIGGI